MRNPFKRNLIGKLIKAAKAPDDRMMYATVAVELTAAQGDDGKPDASRPKAFSMVAYTGGPLQLSAWYYPVVVDLEGLSYKTPMTMLGNHQTIRSGSPATHEHRSSGPQTEYRRRGIRGRHQQNDRDDREARRRRYEVAGVHRCVC